LVEKRRRWPELVASREGTEHDMNLSGRSALITGGGTGIGAAIARQLVAEGVRLMIAGRRVERLEATAAPLRQTGADVHVHFGDLGSGVACKALVRAAIEALGSVDILVNNAGVSAHGKLIEEHGEEDWDAVMGANLKSTFLLTAALLPHMAARASGTIVMLSSISAVEHYPNESLYGLTKRGMNDLAEYVTVEYGAKGIRSFAVCPGLVRTEMGIALSPQLRGEPMIEPEDVAAWVVLALKQPETVRLAGPIVLAGVAAEPRPASRDEPA
jgi:3-oxoacyl-[acyl-carrier protein] reductase